MAGNPTGLETVIIVHGTFSEEAEWWKPNSVFCNNLDAALASEGSSARCWAHTKLAEFAQHDGFIFSWSGRNSEIDRRKWASYLAAYITTLALSDEISRIHIIAHSHGGNVLYQSLRNPTFHNSFILMKLSSVTFLGTPFFSFRSLKNLREPDLSPEKIIQRGFAMLEDRFPPNHHVLNDVAANCIYFSSDEAFQALNHAKIIRADPAIYGHDTTTRFILFMEARYPNFYRTWFSFARLLARFVIPKRRQAVPLILGMTAPWRGWSSIARYFSDEKAGAKNFWTSSKQNSPSKLLILFGWLVLFFPHLCLVLLIFALDFLVIANLLRGARKISKYIEREGIKIVAKSVLGDDFILDRIYEISRTPPFVSNAECVTISEDLEKIASDRAVHYFAESVRKIYGAPSLRFENPDDIRNYLSYLKGVFTNPNFLHCQYYTDETTILQLAKLIKKPSRMDVRKQEMRDFALGKGIWANDPGAQLIRAIAKKRAGVEDIWPDTPASDSAPQGGAP